MLYKFQRIILRGTAFVATMVACSFHGEFAFAEDAETQLVTTMLQDEQRRLPPDNTVLFSAATRSVALQLDAFNQLDSSELAGTMLTVVDADGEIQELKADDDGVIQIANVKPGPHAVIANNDNAHGTTLLFFEEESTTTNLFDESAATEKKPVGQGRMTLVKMKSTDLLPIVDKYLHGSGDLDASLVASDWNAKSGMGGSAFKVRVQEDNELFGHVIPVLRDGLNGSNVEGTHISLFSGGVKVGGAFADVAGHFSIPNVAPGFYGIVAAGPAGYGAFAFEVVRGMSVVQTPVTSNESSRRLVSAVAPVLQVQGGASSGMVSDIVPCVCIPPQYVPYAVESIRNYYPPMSEQGAVAVADGISPVPGAGVFGGVGAFGQNGFGMLAPVSGGVPGVGFGGPAGGGGFGGFGGGFGGIGAIGAIGAAIAASNNNSGGGLNSSLPVSPATP